jgi:DNA repair exonuclease SbcCD ATPase subunit
MNYTSYKTAYDKAVGKVEVLQKQQQEYVTATRTLQDRAKAIEKAQILIQQAAQETQQQLTMHIEAIVASALEAVFPDTYDFKLEFEIKRNKTEAALKFYKDGHEIDIMDNSGGGLVDVAALGLRLSAWSLGSSDNVLILDESLKFLSRDLQPRMGEVLQELSSKLGLGVIMVSHSDVLNECADKIFVVKQTDKVSSVTER